MDQTDILRIAEEKRLAKSLRGEHVYEACNSCHHFAVILREHLEMPVALRYQGDPITFYGLYFPMWMLAV